MSITIEDVKLAIKVIREFLKTQREAERILIQLSRYTSRGRGLSYPFRMEDIMGMLIRQQLAQTETIETTEIEEELTEEDLQRLKEIAKKVRGKRVSSHSLSS